VCLGLGGRRFSPRDQSIRYRLAGPGGSVKNMKRIAEHPLSLSKNSSRFGKVTNTLIFAFLTILLGALGFVSASNLLDHEISVRSGIMMIVFIFVLAGSIFTIILFARKSIKFTLVLILGLAFFLRIAPILWVHTEPISDFMLMLQKARESSAGSFDWARTNTGYFSMWAYQIPFVLFQSLILRISPTVKAIQLVNLLFMTGTVGLIYAIAKKYFSEVAGLIAAFLYAIYPGAIHMASVLTNQHVSLFFMMAGLTAFSYSKRYLGFAAAGLLLGLSNLMRPEGVLIMTALLYVGLIRWIESPEKKDVLQILSCLAVVVAAYYFPQKGFENLMHWVGIAPNGFRIYAPEWKFVLGLDATSEFGGYSVKHARILQIADSTSRKEAVKDIITASFRQCDNIPSFFGRKIEAFWASDEAVNWSTAGLSGTSEMFPWMNIRQYAQGIIHTEAIERTLLYLLAAIGCGIAALRRKRTGLLFAGIVCCVFAVYLLIEVQTRYRYSVIPFVCILAAMLFDHQSNRKIDSPKS
jgi:hypothetical protein